MAQEEEEKPVTRERLLRAMQLPKEEGEEETPFPPPPLSSSHQQGGREEKEAHDTTNQQTSLVRCDLALLCFFSRTSSTPCLSSNNGFPITVWQKGGNFNFSPFLALSSRMWEFQVCVVLCVQYCVKVFLQCSYL